MSVKRHPQSVMLASMGRGSVIPMSSSRQNDPVGLAANDAASADESLTMSVAAKREDIFVKPVLIGVRGWYFQPLKQIQSGYRAVRASCLMPRPANDR
jgi:hypothetical protein